MLEEVALQQDSGTLEMGGRRLRHVRRRSRSPSDCLQALLSGAWLVNCLESGVVEGAVSKTAPLSCMLISGILVGEPGPLLLPGLTYHTEDRGHVPTWPRKACLPSCSPTWGPQVLCLSILLGLEPVPEVVLTHSLSAWHLQCSDNHTPFY